MRRLFTMMWDQVQATGPQLRHWWSTLSLDPSTWLPFTWVLVGAAGVLLLVLLVRPRRTVRRRRPELLISHGALYVTSVEASQADLRAPAGGIYRLSMTVSNLSAVPVQLLELAVRTNGSTAPSTAEVPALLPPHGAVEVSAELRGAGGDRGTIELFVYAPDLPPKTFRVRARLQWEPWNARFRVLALEQDVTPARGVGERRARRPQPPSGRGVSSSRRGGGRSGPRAVDFEEDVRFEPRPGSARPRTSDAARPSPTSAPTGARPRDRLPPDPEPTLITDAAEPPDRAREPRSAAVWPPRRPRADDAAVEREAPEDAAPGAPPAGIGRASRGSRPLPSTGSRGRADTPVPEGRPARVEPRPSAPASLRAGREDAARAQAERRQADRVRPPGGRVDGAGADPGEGPAEPRSERRPGPSPAPAEETSGRTARTPPESPPSSPRDAARRPGKAAGTDEPEAATDEPSGPATDDTDAEAGERRRLTFPDEF